MQHLSNQRSNTFINPKIVTKSHTPATNAPIRIGVPEEHPLTANDIKGKIKHNKMVGSKDKNSRTKKEQNMQMIKLRKILLKKNSQWDSS